MKSENMMLRNLFDVYKYSTSLSQSTLEEYSTSVLQSSLEEYLTYVLQSSLEEYSTSVLFNYDPKGMRVV